MSEFVDRLTYAEEPILKLLMMAAIWAGAIFSALGLKAALSWFAVGLLVILLPRLPSIHRRLGDNPRSAKRLGQNMLSAMVWGLAPFMIWHSGGAKFMMLAIIMVGVGFLMTLDKYRHMPRSVAIVSAPYLMLCAYFLYESRLSPSFLSFVIGAVAYLVTLGWFVYTGYQAKKALIVYKQAHDKSVAGLERVRMETEKAHQTKSVFLANVSHELRTPLNGILGLVDVILQQPMSADQTRKLSMIRDSGHNLLLLLNDILDISKIEADGIVLEALDYNLIDNFSQTLQFWKPLADQKQVKLVFKKQKNLPIVVSADVKRIRQCVDNLIMNALKFTPCDGQVTVSLMGGEMQGRYYLTYTVEDTGIGISEDNVEKLFKPYGQADDTTSRKFGGTGLGLLITKQLTNLLGGDIRVSSVLGYGSKFTMTVLVDIVDVAPMPLKDVKSVLPDELNLQGRQCLIVNNDGLSIEVLTMMLRPLGVDLTIAQNERELVDRLAAQPFDVVLIDLQMSGLGGLATVRKIRDSRKSYAIVPMIAMSDNVAAYDRKKCLEAGMEGYVAKPLNRVALCTEIDAILSQNVIFGDSELYAKTG